MEYCENCGRVHFPNQCRAQADFAQAIEKLQQLWNAYNGFTASKYAAQVYAPVSTEPPSAFTQPDDEPYGEANRLCPHCQPAERVVGHIHGCDGNGCQCPTCNQDTGLLSILTEETERWSWLERWGLAYRDQSSGTMTRAGAIQIRSPRPAA